jgi:formylglycine-generating enzyme required for sulfatase activity
VGPFGVRSLAGGVREWTSTEAEAEAGRYLLRGGAWRSRPADCRVGARATGPANLTHTTIGVRLAADLPPL